MPLMRLRYFPAYAVVGMIFTTNVLPGTLNFSGGFPELFLEEDQPTISKDENAPVETPSDRLRRLRREVSELELDLRSSEHAKEVSNLKQQLQTVVQLKEETNIVMPTEELRQVTESRQQLRSPAIDEALPQKEKTIHSTPVAETEILNTANEDAEQEKADKEELEAASLSAQAQEKAVQSAAATNTIHDDADCPFRDSSIYRKVYVYPDHGDVSNGWKGEMLSEQGKDPHHPRWPFLDYRIQAQANGTGHYHFGDLTQYTTELLVRELMVNPKSCLRTYNPEEATLFYVPYLPSVERWRGNHKYKLIDNGTSKYAQAIADILDKQDYTGWEQHWGLTSQYWKQRGGADHILVFSEPIHGLSHPSMKRGNYHYVHTQKQLTPPIVISVELSKTFVNQYPHCAAKNILVPYPNTDGQWFNGGHQATALKRAQATNLTARESTIALPSERQLITSGEARPIPNFFSAGLHGSCKQLRISMTEDYKNCNPSYKVLKKKFEAMKDHAVAMQLSTFCPCPGGDSPSAKRHFDAVIAQCIPVILSQDYVWPFTKEFDPTIDLDPSRFAIRLKASDYQQPLLRPKTCEPYHQNRTGLQSYLESISAEEIQQLRKGMQDARKLYAWYDYDPQLPEHPLREGILPTGGTAHQVVQMLGERANGARWPECAEELKTDRGKDARSFKC